jgi:hypothetical protein
MFSWGNLIVSGSDLWSILAELFIEGNVFFLYYVLGTFVKNQLSIWVGIYFCILNPVLLTYTSVPVACYFSNYSFVLCFEVRYPDTSLLAFFLLRISLDILGVLCSHMNFYDCFSFLWRKSLEFSWELHWIYTLLLDSHFNILILLIYEHTRYFHFFLFPLNFQQFYCYYCRNLSLSWLNLFWNILFYIS